MGVLLGDLQNAGFRLGFLQDQPQDTPQWAVVAETHGRRKYKAVGGKRVCLSKDK